MAPKVEINDATDRVVMDTIERMLATIPYTQQAHYPPFFVELFGFDHHWQQKERELVIPFSDELAKYPGNPLCAISDYEKMVFNPEAVRYELVIYHRHIFDNRGSSGKVVMLMKKLFADVFVPWLYNETQLFGITIRAYDMTGEKQNTLPFSQFGLSLVNLFLEDSRNLYFTLSTFNSNGNISRGKTTEDVAGILWLVNALTNHV